MHMLDTASDCTAWSPLPCVELCLTHPVPYLQGLPGSSSQVPVLTSYRHVALPKDWHLAWTVLPIVHDSALPPHFTWTPLGLRSPPVFGVLADHLHKVSTMQQSDPPWKPCALHFAELEREHAP